MLTRVAATQETYVLLTGRSAEQVTGLEGCGLFLHPWQIPCKCHCLNRKIGQVEDHQIALSAGAPVPQTEHGSGMPPFYYLFVNMS